MKDLPAANPFSRTRRRAIAQACRDVPRTRGDLGKQLGVDPGGLESTIKAMLGEGVLELAHVPHAKAQAFVLTEAHRAELDDALAHAHSPGLLTHGLRLLLIAGAQATLEAGLEAAATDPAVVWAVRVEGRGRLLIAISPEAPERADQADRLEGIFGRAGAEVVQLLVDEVMDRARVSSYVQAITARPHPRLPPA